jgi:hypothetical protein
MSEGTFIDRLGDPEGYETRRRSSADDDVDAGFGGAAADAGQDDPDIDAEELRSSSDDERRAAFGRTAGAEDARDSTDADDITLRLTEGP